MERVGFQRRAPVPLPPVAAPPPSFLLPPKPLPVDFVYATGVLSAARVLAVFYWARSIHFGKPLVLLEFDVEPLRGDTWRLVQERLEVLGAERRARAGRPVGIFVENEVVVAQIEAHGVSAPMIPAYLTSKDGWQVVTQSTAGILARGDVGYTPRAAEQMDARPFLSAAGVYAGPRTDDPTVAAFLYGVVLGLDEAAARDPNPKPPVRSARN